MKIAVLNNYNKEKKLLILKVEHNIVKKKLVRVMVP